MRSVDLLQQTLFAMRLYKRLSTRMKEQQQKRMKSIKPAINTMAGIRGRNNMKKHKINMTFDRFTLRGPIIIGIIQKAIETTLEQQGVTVPCELNVLVTDDKGIRAIYFSATLFIPTLFRHTHVYTHYMKILLVNS